MIWDKSIKKRIIGLYGDIMSENLLIVVAGIHGNEKAGVEAIQNVFKILKRQNFPTNGCILGLRGNIAALDKNTRFIHKDLNRLWSEEQIDYVRSTPIEQLLDNEDKEQKQLLFILEQFTVHREKSEPFLFLDLHTTSAPGGLFSIVNGNDISVEMAQKLQVPLILNLQSVIQNTTLSIFSKKEFSAIAFEAGQHQDPQSTHRMEAAIMILLHHLHIVRYPREWISQCYHTLQSSVLGLPLLTEFVYKHTILPTDNFQMLPGFKNFDRVEEGQHLANDQNGKIYSKESGYILMPLYQKEGEDGFFIIKEV